MCLFIGERPIRVIGVEDGGTLNPDVHCKKKVGYFPVSAAGMSLTKLSMAGRVLVSDIPAGGGKISNLFFTV